MIRTTIAGLLFFASQAQAQVYSLTCQLEERCVIGEGCGPDERPISWLQIDGKRIEILTADGYLTTDVAAQGQIARWRDGASYFQLEFVSTDLFLLTQYDVDAAPTELEALLPPSRFDRSDGPIGPNVVRIAISTGRCT